MSIKTGLQSLSDWTKELASATKGAMDVTLESGLLKDGLEDLCKVGGVAGAIFKLGSYAIPDASPEQRIASSIHHTFLTALDGEFKTRGDLIDRRAWQRYVKERLPDVAAKKLACDFTWLSIFGSRGTRPSRSWPIVGELADTGSAWLAEAAAASKKTEDLQHLADEVRGRLHDAMVSAVDAVIADPGIRQAIDEARPEVTRAALEFLARELTTFTRFRLFGEVPQDELYITPTIKSVLGETLEDRTDWGKVDDEPNGEEALYNKVHDDGARLVVLQGEMGVGKSCLMRVLAAHLAKQYLSDKRLSPVFIRWRDVYQAPDLLKAIADKLSADYGLPFHELPDHEDIVYLVDGFDEMSSHQEGYLTQCFDLLARIGQGKCTVVVAMRSTVITPALQLAWKSHGALIVQVQEFSDDHVDAWAQRWSERTRAGDITGEKLRNLCKPTTPEGGNVAQNPLLLYMLAKYVYPTAARRKRVTTRTEVFRIFVEETLRGKLRTSQERFPIGFQERDYRMLLQEIAYIASWPKYAPKCPEREARDRIGATVLKDLKFDDIRTAFVLHFFEPGDAASTDFEFQPEGFRHYLLAEWCVRAQIEALREEDPPHLALARTREEAVQALGQIPLREVEREMVNEVYEELGGLARNDARALAKRLEAFGVDGSPAECVQLPTDLYARVRRHAEAPPLLAFEDQKVGVPEGEEVPPGLNGARLLVNYLDQCFLATFGLYRGLAMDPRKDDMFREVPSCLRRFVHLRNAVRGAQYVAGFDLSRLRLRFAQLQFLPLVEMRAHECNLQDADLTVSLLTRAQLTGANMDRANLAGAFLADARMGGASLEGSSLVRANLSDARLEGAKMARCDLREANLSNADLTGADLHDAAVDNMILSGTEIADEQLEHARGKPLVAPARRG